MWSPFPTHYAPGQSEVRRTWCGLVAGWHTSIKSTAELNHVSCRRCWKSIRAELKRNPQMKVVST